VSGHVSVPARGNVRTAPGPNRQRDRPVHPPVRPAIADGLGLIAGSYIAIQMGYAPENTLL